MRMNIEVGDKVLVTTEGWFYAPDGNVYRAAFGTVKAIHSSEDTLGIKTNAKSTNWYLEIGCMTIAGCQLLYAVKAHNVNFGTVSEDKFVESTGEQVKFNRGPEIFNADKYPAVLDNLPE